ncbi:34743_t:CDS:2 [Gigaspora margarita]|uniref:34743_t:CDS:1 n=1 Tax=Gigaspora margarita TaxID=4874 RepID=A0ABN7UP48_GIGMA|nr:34743_t:CDS:2 [Gigaspora margarita]
MFWSYTVNVQISHINVQKNHLGPNWKRDIGPNTALIKATITTPTNTPITTPITTPIVTPITTPLKINITFEQSLMQWTFPIQFGTPPQTLNIPISTTSNILWVVSEFCMNPNGNVCNNQIKNFFNTSLSNTTSGQYAEFSLKYVQESEIQGVFADEVIIINNQIFEQMQIGLPVNINGTGNVTIPNTDTGQIGLKPYKNKQTVGMALSMSSNVGLEGTITFGGTDSKFIMGNNESNIVYQHLPQLTDPNQPFTVNVTNVYINKNPINSSGLILFDSGLQSIHLDDNSANTIINNYLPGGNFSNGIATVDCNISDTFGLFFEIANQKLRLPSNVISKNKVNGTNKCESVITGGANNGNSQIGIAPRSDINYGPPPSNQVKIAIQAPDVNYATAGVNCLNITDQKGNVHAFSPDNVDSDGYYYLSDNYLAQEGFNYSIGFYSGSPSDNFNCSDYKLIITPYYEANATTNLWKINRRDYSVGMKVQIPNGSKCLHWQIEWNDRVFQLRYFQINESVIDNDGYFHLTGVLAYVSVKYSFEAYDDYQSGICWGNSIARNNDLFPDITNDPWAVTLNYI